MIRTTRFIFPFTALALLPTLGCGLEEIKGGNTQDQIPAEVQRALDETCATNSTCHANGSALLNLGPGASAALLDTMASTGDPFVVFGDLEASYLARKILGTNISGGPMPLSNQSPNDEVNLAIILGWIAGAEFSDGGSDTSGDTTDTGGDTTTDTGVDPICFADKPVPALPSFEADVWPTLEGRCTANCHEAMSLVPHMPDSATAFTNMVGVAGSTGMNYVSADAPEDSYLWHKLAGTHAQVGGTGGPMPLIGETCAVELQTIYAWILAGAAP
ncbi:hypothetical protein ACNOYE_00820 [Nannocystaceae bacterium ST9]